MVLRYLGRAGVEIGGKVIGKQGRSVGGISHKLAGLETRHSSSWVGQGQFGRSHASSYRQGLWFFFQIIFVRGVGLGCENCFQYVVRIFSRNWPGCDILHFTFDVHVTTTVCKVHSPVQQLGHIGIDYRMVVHRGPFACDISVCCLWCVGARFVLFLAIVTAES